MSRPTFDQIQENQTDFIGPPRPPKFQPKHVPDFSEEEARAMRDYLNSLGFSSRS